MRCGCTVKLPPNGGGKLINDYSLIMDVKLDALPKDSLCLFQANWGARQTEGSAFISKSGGVGTFGEYGVSKHWLKPGKWTRVVVTMGGSWGANRRMCTYVNAKPCTTINKRMCTRLTRSHFAHLSPPLCSSLLQLCCKPSTTTLQCTPTVWCCLHPPKKRSCPV
jgi:hypothetical protein